MEPTFYIFQFCIANGRKLTFPDFVFFRGHCWNSVDTDIKGSLKWEGHLSKGFAPLITSENGLLYKEAKA